MHKPKGVFHDIANYLGGRVLLVVLGFASFPLMTRILSVSEYGAVSLTLRVVLMLTILSKCGFQYSVTRFYHEATAEGTDAARQRYYTTLVFAPMLIAIAVIAVFSCVLLTGSTFIHDSLFRACLLLAPILVLLRALQSLLLGFVRTEGKSRLYSSLEVTTKALTLLALIWLFASPHRTAVGFLVAVIASESVVVLLQICGLLRRRLIAIKTFDWSLVRTSLVFGIPLVGYELSSIVLDSGDRFLVQHYLGNAQLGLYSAAYNIGAYLQETVMTPLNLALFPVYMAIWAEKGQKATAAFLSSALTWFLVAAALITSLTFLTSQDVIVLLASRRFADAHRLLPIIVPALLLYATHIFLNAGLIIQKRTKLMAALVVVSTVFNLAANAFFIPRYGNLGAAITTLLSYAVLIALMAVVNHRILPLSPDLPLVGESLCAAIVGYFAGALLHPHNILFSIAARSAVAAFTFIVMLAVVNPEVRERLREVVYRKRKVSQKVLSERSAENEDPVLV